MKVRALLLFCVVALASCSQGISYKIFVVVGPDKSQIFLDSIAELAKQHGLETAAAQDVSDTGNVMKVMEGRDHAVDLWVQSVPLSGKEDSKLCGVHPEPYPDPAQFVISTEPRFFGSKAKATSLGERLRSQLQALGFDVRGQSIVCGQAAVGAGQ